MNLVRKLLAVALVGVSSSASASSLLQLYQEAMASDPRIIQAESEAAIYQARERGSLGRLLPQTAIGAQGTRTVRETPGTTEDVRDYYDGERYYFSASQPLFDKSSWEAYRSATKESEQYLEQFQDVKGQVALDLVERYTKVLAAEDNHTFVVAEREAAQEQLKQIQARHARQLASVTDLLAVEARVDVLLSQELDAVNAVQIAREGLSELLGRAVEEPLASLRANVLPASDIGVLDDWLRKGLADSNALQASTLGVKAARTRVKEAAGRHLPTVGLSLSAQKSDIGYENAQVPTSETYVAAVNFNMPLYSGGQVSAQVSEYQARLRMAEQNYQAAERALRRGVREAYLNTRSASERVAASRKALVSAEKSYEAQQKGFKYGTVTVVDVLTASEQRYEARRDHRQALYDLMLYSTALKQVTGDFSPSNIEEIDQWLAVSDTAQQ